MNAVLMVAFVVVFSETAAVAQDSKPASSGQAEPATRGRPLPVANLSPLLEALDSNHDGVIDAEEVANASEALAALDKNSDGQLTPDEYQAAVRRAPSSGRRPPWPVNPNTPRLPPVPGGGLGNFGFVDEHLLRGAQPSTVGIQTLRALGVTTILDLTLPDRNGQAEKAEAERNGLVYTNMPMDSVVRPTTEQVASILSTISNATGRVFIHCQAGKDRTGTIVACYRILEAHWTSEQALREADQFRMAANATWLREFVKDFGASQDALDDSAPEKDSSVDDAILNRLMQRRAHEDR
jgi:tyrosine-protein phosphatase SIW14